MHHATRIRPAVAGLRHCQHAHARRSPLVTADHRADALVTLRGWAEATGRAHNTVSRKWRYRPGFPQPASRRPRPGAGGPGEALYRRADLDTWLAAQERTGPVPAEITRPGPGELVALYQFADLIGRRHATVYQYRRKPGFPQPADGVRYWLGDLLAWWNDPANRPGQGRGGGGWRRRPGSAGD